MICVLLYKNPPLFLCKGVLKLSKSFEDTARRHLLANNLQFRSTFQSPMLNGKHVQKRLDWARDDLGRYWSNGIFTDEFCRPFNYHFWSTSSSKLLQRILKHPLKVHGWRCLL